MSDYERLVARWNRGCDRIREREVAGLPVKESWYEAERAAYREAAEAERRAATRRRGLV